jgi:hypothetical protein
MDSSADGSLPSRDDTTIIWQSEPNAHLLHHPMMSPGRLKLRFDSIEIGRSEYHSTAPGSSSTAPSSRASRERRLRLCGLLRGRRLIRVSAAFLQVGMQSHVNVAL